MLDDYGIFASSIAFAAFLSILPLLSLVALVYGMAVPGEVVKANIAAVIVVPPPRAPGRWCNHG
ncbi:hypothetical protein NHF48_001220 [Sphingomonas sp. H160509]|uniref:hypothetical protein n=1 Tax=Sphingomonas sp. H160509 TaxID=2955313 RepID=UPI0021E8B02F|nr:hypothetical protein [Sphingomonas sp. H160509]MDD1449869.1 hypothetical protein [Sphingomonas sp. H160509]